MKQHRTVYYDDSINDDFAGTSIKPVVVTKDFPFAPTGFLWRVGEWLSYYALAIPLVWAFCCIGCGFRFKNRKALKSLRKTGYFIYANHTHFSDAFLSPLVAFPKKAQVLVSADTVSIKGLRTFIQMLGAIPVPSELSGMPPFMDAMKYRIDGNRVVGIFPEAHIWPYCTFVRDFKVGSFRYPVMWNKPVVAVCVTYQHRRGLLHWMKQPRRTVYISDPIYPDASLPLKESRQKLRDDVYGFLSDTAKKYSDYAVVSYVKRNADRD